jgi:outer membrane protein
MVNQPLTVEQAVGIALRESPVVRGAVEEVEAAAGRLAAARAERRPWISANGFASVGNNMNIVASPAPTQPQMLMGLPEGPFVDANLMVMFPLFTSGRLQAMVRQAAALREASRAELETQRLEVALMTRAAYREVLARRSLAEVWRAKLAEDQERLRVDRVKLREGQIPQLYVLRDEAEVAASQQELTNAERDVELSLLQLKTVIGVNPASRIEVPGVLEYVPSTDLLTRLTGRASAAASGERLPEGAAPPASLPADLAALLRLAERRRPELQAAALRIRAAQVETAAIRSAYGPQVNLFAMGDVLNKEPRLGITAGVAASFPLYSGGQRRARLQTAEAERRRQEQEQQRVALQVSQEVTAALLNLRAAEQNIRTAQAALTSAREDYRVQLLRYQAGRSVLVEVLDALTARTRAESNVVQALYQFNLARDRLLRAVGEPTPSSASSVPIPPEQPEQLDSQRERR